MDRRLRRAARAIFNGAGERRVVADDLAGFADLVQREAGVATVDDVEWLRVLATVQRRLDECERATEFGLPHGNWRGWDVPFEKVEKLYEDMERSGAVEHVQWYLGGNADVRAHDLRRIQDFVARQVQVRLRAMELEPKGADRPPLLRRAGHFMGRHTAAIVSGVAVAVISAIVLAILL